MLDVVYDAFQMAREEQDELGGSEAEVDGMSGFVFTNRFGLPMRRDRPKKV